METHNGTVKYLSLTLLLTASAFFLVQIIARGNGEPAPAPRATAAFQTPWKDDQVIAVADLAKWITEKQHPVVLQVGVSGLYDGAHVPGAVYAGPAEEAAGLDNLRDKAKALARTRDVVIYCGCCPMKNCPNLKPAYTVLQGMGFKKIKILDIPHDFTGDWVNKGFPVEKRG
jgi:thiosulfate/3-mercaptopyruvate sulfurtransferase